MLTNNSARIKNTLDLLKKENSELTKADKSLLAKAFSRKPRQCIAPPSLKTCLRTLYEIKLIPTSFDTITYQNKFKAVNFAKDSFLKEGGAQTEAERFFDYYKVILTDLSNKQVKDPSKRKLKDEEELEKALSACKTTGTPQAAILFILQKLEVLYGLSARDEDSSCLSPIASDESAEISTESDESSSSSNNSTRDILSALQATVPLNDALTLPVQSASSDVNNTWLEQAPKLITKLKTKDYDNVQELLACLTAEPDENQIQVHNIILLMSNMLVPHHQVEFGKMKNSSNSVEKLFASQLEIIAKDYNYKTSQASANLKRFLEYAPQAKHELIQSYELGLRDAVAKRQASLAFIAEELEKYLVLPGEQETAYSQVSVTPLVLQYLGKRTRSEFQSPAEAFTQSEADGDYFTFNFGF